MEPTSQRCCSVDGCKNKYHSCGLCSTHYSQWWHTGAPVPDQPLHQRNRVCLIDGCNGKHGGHGYCVKHYQRWKKYGDPNTVTRTEYDVIQYAAAHQRVRRFKGSATGQLCQHCGDQAEHWAYTRNDPDVIVGPFRPRGAKHAEYSLKSEHYVPLCVKCHVAYDRPRSNRRCSVDKCERRHYALGLCSMHWKRQCKGTPLDSPYNAKPIKAIRYCSVDGCDRKYYGIGLCSMHWQQQRIAKLKG